MIIAKKPNCFSYIGYEFIEDTMCLDYATTYYPDIETGLKKYLKHQ